MLKKKVKIIISVILIIAFVFIGYHCYCHYMVSKFYKSVDEGNTEEMIAGVKEMPDVNMLDICIPLHHIRKVMFQGAAENGYPIYYAVWKQTDISVMEALLERGADLNKKDYDLPFQCLLRYEQEDLYEKVKLFVRYGADIHTDFVRIPGYWKQLSEIEKKERINTVIYLWECGIDVWEYTGTEFERTLLHDAAERLEVEYLEVLYKNQKRPMNGLLNEKDVNGETPLFYAVRANNAGNCEFLINEGADINIRNNEGKTAYDIAIESGYEECMAMLE